MNPLFQWHRAGSVFRHLDSVVRGFLRGRLLSQSRDYFNALKGKYAGRRGFVIGNGPSLTFEDLTKLRDEITIASNKIYLAFPHTEWRPTFHTMADPLLVRKVGAEIHRHVPTTHVPIYLAHLVKKARTRCWTALGDANEQPCTEKGKLPFSEDLAVGTYGGHTISYENLQLAVHLGLNPIYLIGCDHYYQGEDNVKPDCPIPAVAENHFIPGYRKEGEMVNPAPIDRMTRAYRLAKTFAENHGIEMLNATRGGYLEVFPRVDFDSLFSANITPCVSRFSPPA